MQAYQWKETKKEEKKKDNLGGGETTVTRFEYSKVWSDTQINSASFNQPSHNNTISVSGLQCGTENLTNTTVKYGEAGNKLAFVWYSWRAGSQLFACFGLRIATTCPKRWSSSWGG